MAPPYEVVLKRFANGVVEATIPQLPGFVVEAKSSSGLQELILRAISVYEEMFSKAPDGVQLSMIVEELLKNL